MMIMAKKKTQGKKKHMIRTRFDVDFLEHLDRVGEIRIASDGRVYGFEAFVKRMARRGRVI
jgi:hypothetical protein